MEKWDISCASCEKFLLTEARESVCGDIKRIAGSYENGYYDDIDDAFYCKECARKRGLSKAK